MIIKSGHRMGITFTDNQLIFKDISLSDLDLFHRLVTDGEVMRMVNFINPYSIDETKNYIIEELKRAEETPRLSYEFSTFLSDGSTYIGHSNIFIHTLKDNGGIAEIGYILKKESWGKGYATLILKSLIKYAFTNFGIHKIFAKCDTMNFGSEKVMIKNAMVKEGISQKARYTYGEWKDQVTYAILKENYEKSS